MEGTCEEQFPDERSIEGCRGPGGVYLSPLVTDKYFLDGPREREHTLITVVH